MGEMGRVREKESHPCFVAAGREAGKNAVGERRENALGGESGGIVRVVELCEWWNCASGGLEE